MRPWFITRKLKDRIAQLDVENTLLSKQLEAAKSSRSEDLTMSALKQRLAEGLDIDGLKDHVIKFHQLLKEAAEKSNEPVDLSGGCFWNIRFRVFKIYFRKVRLWSPHRRRRNE